MKKALACAAFFAFTASAEQKPIRTGFNSINGQPYNFCSYLEVTGPAAAKASMLKRAKEQYREVDQAALAAVNDHVVVRVVTLADRDCSGWEPSELLFVDKKLDEPALRLPLDADTTVLRNGYGASWTSTDGIATVPLSEFKEALSAGNFKVLEILKSGKTVEIKSSSGMGKSTWSGDHTAKALAP
jgi:hypothetical protein